MICKYYMESTSLETLTVNQSALQIIKDNFAAVGVTDKNPYKVLADGLKAYTVDKDGDATDTPNYKERRECATIILTMLGHLKNKVEAEVIVPTRVPTPVEIEAIQGFVEELRKLNDVLRTNPIQRGEVIDVETIGV